ncbi:MAG TPA: COX15/CtaA family protein [Verrucomicrobiae bacterium]|jgi:cytochrome c oxidase assembly protein subunit 15
MTPETESPWLRRLAFVVVLATFGLIGIGGLVTSKGVGMAVPDWPTTFGYNMFWFPIHLWSGGIFYEHTHRLWASAVGLLTAALSGWIWVRETRGAVRWIGLAAIIATLGLMGVRTQGMFIALAVAALGMIGFCFTRVGSDARAIRWWAALAFCAVLVQGVLGGLRVTAMKDEIGIFHGTLAQLFLVLLAAIALSMTKLWRELPAWDCAPGIARYRRVLLALSALVLLQLILGATMRHQHAGLAIPDFPLAHGKLWPATDAASLAAYNSARADVHDPNPITAAHIFIQMAHRLTAVALFAAAVWLMIRARRDLGRAHTLSRFALGWHVLVFVQACLGVFTVLSNKAADIATLHVLFGALTLVSIALAAVCAFRLAANSAVDATVALPADSRSVRTTDVT